MESSLVTCAPSILALVTSYLELHEVIRFLKYCGDVKLMRLAVVHSGVLVLRVRSIVAAQFLKTMACQLPTFKLLMRVNINMPES